MDMTCFSSWGSFFASWLPSPNLPSLSPLCCAFSACASASFSMTVGFESCSWCVIVAFLEYLRLSRMPSASVMNSRSRSIPLFIISSSNSFDSPENTFFQKFSPPLLAISSSLLSVLRYVVSPSIFSASDWYDFVSVISMLRISITSFVIRSTKEKLPLIVSPVTDSDAHSLITSRSSGRDQIASSIMKRSE